MGIAWALFTSLALMFVLFSFFAPLCFDCLSSFLMPNFFFLLLKRQSEGRRVGRKRETERWRDRGREMTRAFTDSLSKCLPQLGWTKLKSGVQTSDWISQVESRSSATWAFTYCLPGNSLTGSCNAELHCVLNPVTLTQAAPVPIGILTTVPNMPLILAILLLSFLSFLGSACFCLCI